MPDTDAAAPDHNIAGCAPWPHQTAHSDIAMPAANATAPHARGGIDGRGTALSARSVDNDEVLELVELLGTDAGNAA